MGAARLSPTGIHMDGGGGNNSLYGGTQSDTLNGDECDDFIVYGYGSDHLDGGIGNDTTYGGAGSNVYTVDNAADVIYENEVSGALDEVQSGVIDLNYANYAYVEVLSLLGSLNLDLTGVDDVIQLNGNDGDSQIFTISGMQAILVTMFGLGGNDQLLGDYGSDVMYGGDSNDFLSGSAGFDKAYGGNGGDLYLVNSTFDLVVEANSGGVSDEVQAANLNLKYANYANAESMTLLGTVSLSRVGGGPVVQLNGHSGNNRISNISGAATMAGNGGLDTCLVAPATTRFMAARAPIS